MSNSPTNDRGAPSAALWLVDGRSVAGKDLEHGMRQLSPAETHRFAHFKRPERQRQYLLGRMLLRCAISHIAGVPSTTIGTIDRPGLGPRLVLPEDVRHPYFSLSHSHHWIACAVSFDSVLGLDIEAIDPARDVIALSDAGFHSYEHAWLIDQPDGDRIAAFYRLWTLKEALFKLLSNAGKPQEVTPVADCHGNLLSQGDEWFSSRLQHPGYTLAICSTQSLSDIAHIEPSALV